MRDRRLRIDPSLEELRSKQSTARELLRSACGPGDWEKSVAPLVAAIRCRAAGGRPFPEESARSELLPAEFVSSWIQLFKSICDPRVDAYTADDHTAVIVSETARYLAKQIASAPSEWRSTVLLDLPDELLVEFCSCLPVQALQKHAGEILAWTPSDPLDGIDSYERWGREVVEVQLVELVEAREARGVWSFVTRVKRFADAATPRGELVWAGPLVARAGAEVTRKWLNTFTHPLSKAVAVAWLDYPTLLQDVLDLLAKDQERDEFVLLLIASRIVDLWESIDDRLAHAANGVWKHGQDDGAQERFQSELHEWRTKELPERMALWVAAACAAECISQEFLRNTFVARWRNEQNPPAVRVDLRELLIRKIVTRHPVDEIVQRLLEPRVNQAALLSAGLAVYFAKEGGAECSSAASRLVLGYTQIDEDQVHGSPLVDDHVTCPWVLAHALALTPSPQDTWICIERKFSDQREGWGIGHEPRHSRSQRRRHAFIVGAMATEWLFRYGNQKTQQVFDTVWDQVHCWSRSLVGIMDWELASRPLVEIWARLALIHPDDAQTFAITRIAGMDHVEWLSECVGTLELNLEKRESHRLDTPLRTAVRDRFNVLRVTWENERVADAERRQRMVDRIEALVGD